MTPLTLRNYAKYAVFCAPLAVVACGDDDDIIPDILDGDRPTEILEENPQFSSLVDLLDEQNLNTDLNGQDSLTLFAPNNGAIAAVATAYASLSDDEKDALLLYHAVGADIPSSAILEGTTILRDANNATPSIVVFRDDNQILINDASVVTPDLITANGRIHEIDEVLMMPNAFELTELIDDIEDLSDALDLRNLADAVATTADITVLAPTNEAFDNTFPEGADDATVDKVLQYHVIPKVILAADITNGQTETTLEGSTLTFNTSADGVTVTDEAGNTRNIEETNIRGTNGVIHTIDGLLLVVD